MGYVAAGYSITIVVLGGYVARTVLRARALRRRFPES
jgi:CcmD family protein